MTMTPEECAALEGHTPGPWHTTPNGYVNQWQIYSENNGAMDPIGVVYGGATEPNRGLIAAAPDLLATVAALRAEVADWERASKIDFMSIEHLRAEVEELKAVRDNRGEWHG